jgi:hypothetical protein
VSTGGRKDINLGSVIGSAIGSGSASIVQGGLKSFFQNALPLNPLAASLMANGFGTAPAFVFPGVLSTIGSTLELPQ